MHKLNWKNILIFNPPMKLCSRVQIRFYFFVFIFVLPFILYSQNKIHIVEVESEAEANFDKQNFEAALALFLKLDSLRPATKKYIYKAGVCYTVLGENVNALKFLERCKDSEDKHPRALNYYLGRAYLLSHRMNKAIEHYTDFLYDVNVNGYKSNDIKQLSIKAEREMIMCKNGKELMANPIQLEVVNLGPKINTSYPEYAPVISADETELIFTSRRLNAKEINSEALKALANEDVYSSTKENGQWLTPVQMSSNINTATHDASIALSPDGQTLFLYRFDEKGETIAYASGNLYTSKLKGTVWSMAERLNDKVNTDGWEPSASITEDGNTLFFASDKPGGKGGTDLYFSKKLNDGSWDVPTNMGDNINTLYDDDSPFIHPDGKTLYFSSKGHNGMGGFDIFVSNYNSAKKMWDKPENIGYPISTARDDIHFVIAPNAKRIYFSSNREGGYGDMDIYYANIENKESAKVLLMTGIVTDSVTEIPVEVTIRTKDKNNNEEIATHKSNSSTGKYILVLNEGKNYDLIFSSTKFGSHYESVDLTNETEYKEVVKNIVLKKRDRNIVLQLEGLDSSKLSTTKITVINVDSGEEIILDGNSNTTGTYFVKLKEGNCYSIEVEKADYIFASMKINVPMIEEEKKDPITYHLKLQPIKEGTVLLLKNIYFASNETVPLVTSFPELDRLVIFMKQNPGTVIEIAAHTDNVGNADYNLKLSDKRAKAVINYIVGKGIPTVRLKSIGMGDSQPISTGVTEEEKQKNRRVELKILKIEEVKGAK
jgi:outer membrane protein OmpA-like peptidoglycan-associated protein/tetratricopeptide (TPR) repeat protein